MTPESTLFIGTVLVGLGATLFMDVCMYLVNRAFGIPLASYCLVGRWLCHMPEGTFMHEDIAAARQKRGECAVGWISHYMIGMVYALVLVAFVTGSWLAQPALLPALIFGMMSVLVPYLIMQPSFGLGIAASRAPQPTQTRLRSLMAHTAFGVGLYISAVCVGYLLRSW